MRLIDTQTHLLLEPWKASGKEYAILSHTWGDQEVIFQEWEQLYPSGAIKGQCPHVRHQGIDQKAGYHKVMQACEQARCDGIRYLWCDTMCINKESSAELSEAINSMFKWYRDAKICYVYLTDVVFPSKKTRNGFVSSHSSIPGWFPYATERNQDGDVREMKSRFIVSRWWTRGWTLQELLAPKKVVFFTQDWTVLGHKTGISHWISALTRIHRKALEDHTTIRNFSIAQRMSWAADRTTTVPEDLAYCLMGIFDVNMPMLYGQGEGAFQKLQHEIAKTSGDQSIFAWAAEKDDSAPWTGALARSPRSFRSCGSIVRDPQYTHEPYSLTNVGFKMRTQMIQNIVTEQCFIGLGCFLELHGESHQNGTATSRRWIRVWIPVRVRGTGGSYDRAHFPTSHVYFQSTYPSNKVLESPEIFLCELPYSSSAREEIDIARGSGVNTTGIAIAIGFGTMSMLSGAYKDVWPPQRFRIIPIGTREPRGMSHEVMVNGAYCLVLSVSWDERGRPRTHMYTTLHVNSQNLPRLVDQIRQTELVDASVVHQRLRSANHHAITANDDDAPLIIVEDEPLYDMHQFPSVMVEVIFKEKPKPIGGRK